MSPSRAGHLSSAKVLWHASLTFKKPMPLMLVVFLLGCPFFSFFYEQAKSVKYC